MNIYFNFLPISDIPHKMNNLVNVLRTIKFYIRKYSYKNIHS